MGIRARLRDRRAGERERGAAMVEMAFVMILLILLVMGIVEFGFLFGQFNEVRHGAHEGARLAAVNDSALGDNTCGSMNLPASDIDVDFTHLGGGELGDQATVTVTLDRDSLSGMGLIEVFLPAQLSTTADFRLEQDATWTDLSQDKSPCP